MLNLFKKKDPIANFWIWFERNKARLESNYTPSQDKILEEGMSELVKITNGLAFEVSKEIDGVRDIVISANGDREKFDIVKQIVEKSPQIQGWTVTAFRQRIKPDFTVEAEGHKFSPEKMFFTPFRYQDALHLNIYIEKLDDSNFDMFTYFAFLIIDNVLGEYDSVTKLGGCDFKNLEDIANKSELKPLTELPNYIDNYN